MGVMKKKRKRETEWDEVFIWFSEGETQVYCLPCGLLVPI